MTPKYKVPLAQFWLSRDKTRSLGFWACIAALLLLFVGLAEDVVEREPMRFDTPLLLWLHSHATPLFDSLMLLLTWLGGTPIFIISGVFLVGLVWIKQRRAATSWAIALSGTGLLNIGGKLIFQRARPDLWLSLSPEHDYGFPSGHSMISAAFVMALLLLVWRTQLSAFLKWTLTGLGVLFVMGVGLSRLYLGVHYPSDVVAGWALSAAWIMLLQKALELPTTRRQQ